MKGIPKKPKKPTFGKTSGKKKMTGEKKLMMSDKKMGGM